MKYVGEAEKNKKQTSDGDLDYVQSDGTLIHPSQQIARSVLFKTIQIRLPGGLARPLQNDLTQWNLQMIYCQEEKSRREVMETEGLDGRWELSQQPSQNSLTG